MKHKTWFRLVLKAIGVLLIGFSLPTVGRAVGELIYAYLEGNQFAGYPANYWIVQSLYYGGTFVQFLLGLYLFFGGKWLVNMAIPSNRPYCPECGYDLSRCKGAQCPECGIALPYCSEESRP